MPKVQFLDSSIGEIKIIYHISDIHIRKRCRHDEYLEVFERFIQILRDHEKLHGKDFIIVVTGDIMHDKSELVPESVDMLRKFLVMLSDITEVVMIIGNHDTNIFNKGSMDCLTPIIKDLYTRYRIHLLNENSVYLYGNNCKDAMTDDCKTIIFGVTTLWAKKVTKIEQQDILEIKRLAKQKNIALNEDFVKIGLYHGMIHGCTLDNGMKAYSEDNTNSTYFNQSDFDSYQYVMFGDVHKHQYLNKKKTMAYSGSLIQQKRDEDLIEHGTIRWDIKSNKSEFIKIKNDYGMIQIKIGSDKKSINKLKQKLIVEYDNKDIPKNLDIKIVYNSSEGKEYFKKMYNVIMKNHNIIKTSEITDTVNVNGLNVDLEDVIEKLDSDRIKDMKNHQKNNPTVDQTENTDDLTLIDKRAKKRRPVKINDNAAVTKIMMDHLAHYTDKMKKTTNIESTTQNEIKKEITDILNEINYNFEREIKNISLKSIEFNNMFVYTEQNKIDFEKFRQLVGLNASNYQGKSSFIDIVLYSIYGECSRGKRYDVLNINSKKMNSRIVMDVNSREYIITRTSFVNSSSHRDLKESVNIWEDGENITADDRVKTHKLIEKKICSYDDMINNSFVLQKNGRSFVDLTDRQKKDLLCKMARLDIFDNIFIEAKSRHCSAGQTTGKLMKKLDQYDEILIDGSMTDKSMISKKKKSIVVDVKKSTTKNNSNKLLLIESAFDKKINSVTKGISQIDLQILKLETNMESMNERYHQLNSQISVYDVQKNVLKNYDEEKILLNKKCRELIGTIDLALSIGKVSSKIKKGRDLTEIKKSEMEIQKKKEVDAGKLNFQIESNLKMISHSGTEEVTLNDATSSLNDLQEQLIKNQNDIMTMMHNKNKLESEIMNIEHSKQKFKDIEIEYLEKQKLLTQITDLEKSKQTDNKLLNQHIDQIHELENHEYNPECEQCMKNPVTKTVLSVQEKIKHTKISIRDINTEIKKIEQKIEKMDTSIDSQYIVMKERQDSIDSLKLELERLNNTMNLTQKDILLLHQNIQRLTETSVKIKRNSEIEEVIKELKNQLKQLEIATSSEYEKCIELKRKLSIINAKIRSNLTYLEEISSNNLMKSRQYSDYVINMIETLFFQKELDQINKRISRIKEIISEKKIKRHELNTTKIRLEFELNKFKEIKEDIDTVERKKLILGYIKKILDKNGLVDTLLSKNIIPYLQTSINGILTEVGHYQVDITYKNQSVNVYKDNGLNIVMSSGYESYLLDLVFRLALVQINNHVKTDFLVIDEGFNACDADNKNNIKELLEYMRSYYKWILIISHDEFVKSFYDMDIRIMSSSSGSRLCNTDTFFVHRNDEDGESDKESDEKTDKILNEKPKRITKKKKKSVKDI